MPSSGCSEGVWRRAGDPVLFDVATPTQARSRSRLLFHAHPLYGGSMLTPVILTVEGAFHAAGFTTLAFNFRGVGGSEGTHGEGRAEVADVAGALAHLRAALGGQPNLVAVAGYSFGSYVGGQPAVADPGVGFYLGVAPLVARYDYGFLAGLRGRIALIAGTRDEYSDPARLEALPSSFGFSSRKSPAPVLDESTRESDRVGCLGSGE